MILTLSYMILHDLTRSFKILIRFSTWDKLLWKESSLMWTGLDTGLYHIWSKGLSQSALTCIFLSVQTRKNINRCLDYRHHIVTLFNSIASNPSEQDNSRSTLSPLFLISPWTVGWPVNRVQVQGQVMLSQGDYSLLTYSNHAIIVTEVDIYSHPVCSLSISLSLIKLSCYN